MRSTRRLLHPLLEVVTMVLIDVFETRKPDEFEGGKRRFGRELWPFLFSSWPNIDFPTDNVA